jgi:hypothetical protein
MSMQHVSLHDTIDTPLHTHAHTRLREYSPPYNTFNGDYLDISPLFYASFGGIVEVDQLLLETAENRRSFEDHFWTNLLCTAI